MEIKQCFDCIFSVFPFQYYCPQFCTILRLFTLNKEELFEMAKVTLFMLKIIIVSTDFIYLKDIILHNNTAVTNLVKVL